MGAHVLRPGGRGRQRALTAGGGASNPRLLGGGGEGVGSTYHWVWLAGMKAGDEPELGRDG